MPYGTPVAGLFIVGNNHPLLQHAGPCCTDREGPACWAGQRRAPRFRGREFAVSGQGCAAATPCCVDRAVGVRTGVGLGGPSRLTPEPVVRFKANQGPAPSYPEAAADATEQRARAPTHGQHRSSIVRSRRMAGREAWRTDASVLAEAAHATRSCCAANWGGREGSADHDRRDRGRAENYGQRLRRWIAPRCPSGVSSVRAPDAERGCEARSLGLASPRIGVTILRSNRSNVGGEVMAESVYKVIELVGTSSRVLGEGC